VDLDKNKEPAEHVTQDKINAKHFELLRTVLKWEAEEDVANQASIGSEQFSRMLLHMHDNVNRKKKLSLHFSTAAKFGSSDDRGLFGRVKDGQDGVRIMQAKGIYTDSGKQPSAFSKTPSSQIQPTPLFMPFVQSTKYKKKQVIAFPQREAGGPRAPKWDIVSSMDFYVMSRVAWAIVDDKQIHKIDFEEAQSQLFSGTQEKYGSLHYLQAVLNATLESVRKIYATMSVSSTDSAI
jgi:hypothetical protein